MTDIICIAYLLVLLVLIVWLRYELRTDKRDRTTPTAQAPLDQLPPL